MSRSFRWCSSSTTSSSISSNYSNSRSTCSHPRASASTMPQAVLPSHRSRVRSSWHRLRNPSLPTISSRSTIQSNSSSSKPSNRLRRTPAYKRVSTLSQVQRCSLLSNFSQDHLRTRSLSKSFRSSLSPRSPSFRVSSSNSLSSSIRPRLSPSRTLLLCSIRLLLLSNPNRQCSSNSKCHLST